MYAADGQSINMEYIYEFFNNRNCPLLRGKPKFFIVQSCRGDRPDAGVAGEDAAAQHVSKKRRAAESSDGVSEGGAGDVARARPTWEDMVIAYSTIPGRCVLESPHSNVTHLIARVREPPGPRQGHLVHPVAGGGVHGARPRHGAGGPPAHDQVTGSRQ